MCRDGCLDLECAVAYDCLVHFKQFYREMVVDKHGATLLHNAAERKCPKVLEYLLEKQVIDVNATDYYGYTPLHLAVGDDNKGRPPSYFGLEDAKKCVKLLMEYGADPYAKIFYGKKSTPIEIAQDGDLVEIMENELMLKEPCED